MMTHIATKTITTTTIVNFKKSALWLLSVLLLAVLQSTNRNSGCIVPWHVLVVTSFTIILPPTKTARRITKKSVVVSPSKYSNQRRRKHIAVQLQQQQQNQNDLPRLVTTQSTTTITNETNRADDKRRVVATTSSSSCSSSSKIPTAINKTIQIAQVVVLVNNPADHTIGSSSNNTTTTTTKRIQIHPETFRNITEYVQLRANARRNENYTLADMYKSIIDTIPIHFSPVILDGDPNHRQNHRSHDDTNVWLCMFPTAPATTDSNQYPVIVDSTTNDEEDNDIIRHHNRTNNNNNSNAENNNSNHSHYNTISFRVAITDISRKMGGGSTWSLICTIPITTIRTSTTTNHIMHDDSPTTVGTIGSDNTVLSYAHRALGIAVTKSDRTTQLERHNIKNSNIDRDLQLTIQNAKEQLQNWNTIRQQLHPFACPSEDADGNVDVTNRGNSSTTITNQLTTTIAATASAAMSLDQLWELLTHSNIDSNYCNRDSNALYHWYMVETRLSGRTAADAAFWFAMAGIVDDELYHLLIQVIRKELLRFGARASCRYKDIIDIVTRCAAAGIRDIPELESIIDECIQTKIVTKKDRIFQQPYLHLHTNDDSVLVIWHFATRQRKQRTFLQTAAKHYVAAAAAAEGDDNVVSSNGLNTEAVASDGIIQKNNYHDNNDKNHHHQSLFKWNDMFDDPTRPLVIDIGCGMGISLLGLASISDNTANDCNFKGNNDTTQPQQLFPYHLCNFIGVDLSSLSINYACGMAQRWNIHRRLAFVVDTAENFLDRVLSSNYPGSIHRILIQFPTPYRLSAALNNDDSSSEADDFDDDGNNTEEDNSHVGNVIDSIVEVPARGGNTQLPASIRDGGFMVTTELLQKVSELLLQKDYSESDTTTMTSDLFPNSPDLLLQSNCEDVAVLMRNMACKEAGFIVPTELAEKAVKDEQEEIDTKPFPILRQQPTQRTMNWLTANPNGERAIGEGWWMKSVLPNHGRTETEVACILNDTPIHRCIVNAQGGAPMALDRRTGTQIDI